MDRKLRGMLLTAGLAVFSVGLVSAQDTASWLRRGFDAAQDVIPLYPGPAPGSPPSNYPEQQYFSKTWNAEVVTNVTSPTLTVFKPSPELRNGTAVVICPGGGFMALSINNEGYDVAKYLTA